MSGGDYGRIGEGIAGLFVVLTVTCLCAIPLAVWKLAELIGWAVRHVHITP